MICKKCGAEVKDNDKFCSSCGTSISKSSKEEKPKNKSNTLSNKVIKNNKKIFVALNGIIAIIAIVGSFFI